MNEKNIIWIFIVSVGGIISFLIPPGYRKGESDFLRYYSASKLLVSGGNPYNPVELSELQIELRPYLKNMDDIVQAWNPPWLLLLLSPYVLMNFDLANKFWMFLNIALVTWTLYILWKMVTDSPDPRGFIFVLCAGFLFGNTIRLIRLGQISALLLFGITLCIWCLINRKYFGAGMAMLLLIIKPHVTFLVLAVILIWVIQNRKWEVIIGFAITMVSSLLVVSVIFPGWWAAYINNLNTLPYTQLYMTTVGSFMYWMFGISYFNFAGLLCLPLSIPLAKYVNKADWLTVINLSLVISLPVAPYGFSFDHILYLPALVQLIGWIRQGKLPNLISWMIIIGLIAEYIVLMYFTAIEGLPYYWFVCVSIGLTGLYLIAWKIRNEFKIQTI